MKHHDFYDCRWDIFIVRDGRIIFEMKDKRNILVDEGEKAIGEVFFRNLGSTYFPSTNFFVGLYKGSISESTTLATIPNEPSGNGYSRLELERSAVGFPTVEQDDGDWRWVSKQLTLTASGGTIGPVNGAFLGYLNEVERTWGKPWLKGDLRYTILAFESAFKYKPVKTKITVDDQVREIDLSFFALGFGDVLGGYKVLPDNHPQKGDLGVVFLKDYKGFKLIWSMIRLMFQSIKKNKKAEILYGKKITLESEKKLTWVTEGEIFSQETKKIEFGITSKTINLIVPEDWKYDAPDADKDKYRKKMNKGK